LKKAIEMEHLKMLLIATVAAMALAAALGVVTASATTLYVGGGAKQIRRYRRNARQGGRPPS
jgi:hypothetical protein